MLVLLLTGGIDGQVFVTDALRALDVRAGQRRGRARVMPPGGGAVAVRDAFGDEVISWTGVVRAALSKLVLGGTTSTTRILSWSLHPLVEEARGRFLNSRRGKHAFVVLDIPLWHERAEKTVDGVIVVAKSLKQRDMF